MRIAVGRTLLAALALALVGATLLVKWQFDNDMQRARAHAAQGSASDFGVTSDFGVKSFISLHKPRLNG